MIPTERNQKSLHNSQKNKRLTFTQRSSRNNTMISINTETGSSERTINLNNEAVSLINQGKHENAAKILGHALTLSKQNMLGASDSVCSKAKANFSLDHCMIQSASTNKLAQHTKGGSFYIYQQAILLPQNMPADFDSSIITSIIIIFNLALAHHLVANDHAGVEKQRFLKKAAKLYELALNLHSQEKNLDSTIYIMACVNNLGLIYRELSDVSTAERCFQHLLQTLMFMVDCRRDTFDFSLLDGFFNNATRRMCKRTTAAAA
jgi:tetratricopeptide (TPR) repeat protein